MKDDDAVILRTAKSVASRDYECFGCVGECPITTGDNYLRVTVKHSGKIKTLHYCQRCDIAIMHRIVHSKTHSVDGIEKGAFCWSRLSSAFKKTWKEMIIELARLRSLGLDDSEATSHYLDKLGYNAFNNIKEQKMETGQQKKTRGKTHPAQKKLTALRKQLHIVASEIAGCLDKLTVEQLAAKVDAMNRTGDTSHNDKCTESKRELERLLEKLCAAIEAAK